MAAFHETIDLGAVAVEPHPVAPPLTADRLAAAGLDGLHCGCGRTLFPGCVNTDVVRFTGAGGAATEPGRLSRIGRAVYLQHDAAAPYALGDGSVSWVYAEHFLEHLTQPDAVRWLREARRVLRPGGFVRLSTPDLRKYVAGYLDPASGFFARHRDQLKQMGMKQVPDRPAWMVNQIFKFWGHEWIYDTDEVRTVAAAAGFDPAAVEVCSFRQGRNPTVAGFDQAVRSDESLYVEIGRG